MGGEGQGVTGPDLAAGIAVAGVPEGKLVAGHVGQDPVMLARRGTEWFAIGAVCSHYSGPLPEGLMVGGTVRCPWHHACFSLRTGQVLRPPALNDVACWRVERQGGMGYVRGEKPPPRPGGAPGRAPGRAKTLPIVGGGAGGGRAAGT